LNGEFIREYDKMITALKSRGYMTMDCSRNFDNAMVRDYGITRFHVVGKLASCCEFILADSSIFVNEYTKSAAQETQSRWREFSYAPPPQILRLNAMDGCFGAVFRTSESVSPVDMFSTWDIIAKWLGGSNLL